LSDERRQTGKGLRALFSRPGMGGRAHGPKWPVSAGRKCPAWGQICAVMRDTCISHTRAHPRPARPVRDGNNDALLPATTCRRRRRTWLPPLFFFSSLRWAFLSQAKSVVRFFFFFFFSKNTHKAFRLGKLGEGPSPPAPPTRCGAWCVVVVLSLG